MNNLFNEKYYNILELNKIINMLKEEVYLESNIDLIASYPISNDIEEIKEMLDETDEASILLQRLS